MIHAALLLVLATPAPAGATRESRIAPPDSYARQLTFRLHGALAQVALTDARLALHDETVEMRRTGWDGSLREGETARGYGGGLEASWGAWPDVKLTAALEAVGASAEGGFEGTGPGTTTVDPVVGLLRQRVTRLARYAAMAQMVGATVLLRDFDRSRLGLAGRLGAVELAGAVERGREEGPLRTYWWQRRLSGAAPALWLGLEWEWLGPAKGLGIPLALHGGLGWRWAAIRRVESAYTDSTGARTDGAWKHADGTRRSLDLSGVEARLGVQVLFDLTPGDEPPRPGVTRSGWSAEDG